MRISLRYRTLLGLLLPILLLAPHASRADNLEHASQAYDFASYLLSEGEYYRAVTEFRRVMYWSPTRHELGSKAILGVGQALYAGGEFARAGEWLAHRRSSIPQEALHTESLRLMCRSFLTGWRAERITQELGDSVEAWDDGEFYLAVALAQTSSWGRAKDGFLSVTRNSNKYEWALFNADTCGAAQGAGGRSPTLGGVLGIIPGAGYLYSGHHQSAFSTLLVCGLFGWATVESFKSDNDVLGVVLGAITITWYGSSIYGSVKAADRYNARQQRELFGELKW